MVNLGGVDELNSDVTLQELTVLSQTMDCIVYIEVSWDVASSEVRSRHGMSVSQKCRC